MTLDLSQLIRQRVIWLQTQGTKAGQRALVSRRSVLAIKPRLVPILWMAWRLSIRKEAISPAFNGDSTKFQARPVGALVLAVQIKELSKEQQAGLFSKIDFAEYLEVAYI